MKRHFQFFFLLLFNHAFSQQINDNQVNTIELTGFSVSIGVEDSLTIINDSIKYEAITNISRKDSIRFLNYSIPNLGILKNFSSNSIRKDIDSINKRFEIMRNIGIDHDSRLLSIELISQLLDSFSLERTTYKLRMIELRKVVQKPIKEMSQIDITDYKIFYSDGTQKHLDTTLNISKDYRFNYLRKDYFEVLTLPNTGEGYNKLGYNFQAQKKNPQLGAKAKHFAYLEEKETPYYEVPSPLTELFFKSVFEQGQMVDALITVNTSPRFNISLAHKAFRSLGKYINSLGGGTNFLFTTKYTSKNYRYRQHSHYAAQRLENQANGGLDSLSVYFFEKAVDELEYDGFLDRSRLSNNIEVDNSLVGRRYYVDQQYDVILGGNDNMFNYERPKILTLGLKINYEVKQFFYKNTKTNNFFGSLSGTPKFNVSHHLDLIDNEFYGIYNNKLLGQIKAGIQLLDWDYFIVFPDDSGEAPPIDRGPDPSEIEAKQLAIDSYWKKSFLKFDFKSEFYLSFRKQYATQFLSSEISKYFRNDFFMKAKWSFRSQAPNFNFFLHKSNYIDYNWYNPNLKDQKINSLEFTFEHPVLGSLSGLYNILHNYTYFKNLPPKESVGTSLFDYGVLTLNSIEEDLVVIPLQFQSKIHYLKLRWNNELSFGKFSLVNTFQYQKVSQNESPNNFKPLNVPEWNMRSSLFFSSQLFKNALFLQTGITAQYFTKYYGDRYSAIIGEFVSQNHTEIGDFPRIDFFVNAKVQQTRIFLKFEHINDDSTGYNYYSAPFTPYRDSILRFGIVWNFFQ